MSQPTGYTTPKGKSGSLGDGGSVRPLIEQAHSGGAVTAGQAVTVRGTRSVWDSVLPTQFPCEPKTALKTVH